MFGGHGFARLGALSPILLSRGPSIQLSASQDTDGDTQGTAIGVFSVNGGTGTYTFTLNTNGGGTVQVAGPNGVNLQVGATAPSIGTVSISVHADNGAGSTVDQAFTITSVPRAPSLALDPAFDTGTAGDNITSINNPNLIWTLNSFEQIGDVLTRSDGQQHTITQADIDVGTFSFSGSTPLSDGVHSITGTHSRGSIISTASAPLALTIEHNAPTLSAASGSQATQTSATLHVTTDQADGKLFVVVLGPGGSAPSAAQVVAGTDGLGGAPIFAANQAVSASGLQARTASPLNVVQTDTAYFVHQNAAGVNSAVASATWSQADITAPILSNQGVKSIDATSETLDVDTDTANGTAWWIVSASNTPPSIAQIQAGHESSGGTAVATNGPGGATVTSAGTQSFTPTGLTAATNYYAYFQHRDAAGNNSSVVGCGPWQTDAGEIDTIVSGDWTAAFINSSGNQHQHGGVLVNEG